MILRFVHTCVDHQLIYIDLLTCTHTELLITNSLFRYYYEDRNLFYDPNSQNYYSYDREKNTFAFHSTLEEVLKQTKEKKKEVKPNKDTDCEDGKCPTGKLIVNKFKQF